MRGAAALVVALFAAGCVSRPVEQDDPAPVSDDPVEAMANMDFRIECETARIQIPWRLEKETRQVEDPESLQVREVAVRRLRVRVREDFPEFGFGGEDFSVIAEGNVRTFHRTGKLTVEEGPFQTVILRNGKMMKR